MAEQQMILSIGREFGSGGHRIAEILSQHFGLPLYDAKTLTLMSDEEGVDGARLMEYDESPFLPLVRHTKKSESAMTQEEIHEESFEYIRKLAQDGKSFIVIGRCSEEILLGYEGLIRIFILGSEAVKVQRIMDRYNIDEEDAATMRKSVDQRRKAFHNRHCKGKWGDNRNYDICINSDTLGVEGTATMLIEYIDRVRSTWD